MADEKIMPVIKQVEFTGFDFSKEPTITDASLTGYQYQTINGKTISIYSCKQANEINLSQIPEFEFFRFNLLLLSCEAFDRYSQAKTSKITYFKSEFKPEFLAQLPAEITPLLNKTDKLQRQNKTLHSYNKDIKISLKNSHTAKLLTPEDEIYITLLARGDFNSDKKEDLLIKSEWFSRNAFGKHADLIILSKTSKDEPVKIIWRLHPIY